MNSLPKISVITIVFNGEELIERTIKSVLNQSYQHVEYIIIDGNSRDKTLEIIQKYENRISKWISEPDKGLYDAMNKGLNLATGDFIIYMNAGDLFFQENVLENVFATSNLDFDILYGETEFINDKMERIGLRSEVTPHKLPLNLKWQDMKLGMVVCHQSIFIRRNIAPLYDINHPICADIDWIIKSLKQTDKVKNCQLVVSKYLVGGLSEKKLLLTLKDRFLVLKEHFGLTTTFIAHIRILFRAFSFKYFKR